MYISNSYVFNIQWIMITFIGLWVNSSVSAQDISGIWLTAGKEAKIEIVLIDHNKYEGRLIWTADDSEKSKNAIGALIIKDFKKIGDNLYKGTITDINKNRTYNATIKMVNSEIIDVRGYVGISLFGRTEKWHRTLLQPNDSKYPYQLR